MIKGFTVWNAAVAKTLLSKTITLVKNRPSASQAWDASAVDNNSKDRQSRPLYSTFEKC